jgi:hypothetical protein
MTQVAASLGVRPTGSQIGVMICEETSKLTRAESQHGVIAWCNCVWHAAVRRRTYGPSVQMCSGCRNGFQTL